MTPAGSDLTVPAPAPAFATVSARSCTANVATTDRARSIVSVHEVLVPTHSPDQPAKTEPAAGAATSVTTVPCAYEAEHTAPQSIDGALTPPVPPPDRATVSVFDDSKPR